ncbi:lipase 1-like [Achroia grisella]|uniref:lipase 1-like n=1 Tax=Achroia grisella TaxID=688607 RepID=UPI0027D2DFD4|nr:lipase 1-like [Achroia grisella]
MPLKGRAINILLLSSIVILFYAIKTRPFVIRNETKQDWGYPKDSLLNFTELTMEYGYHSEEHTVLTEDGYLLKIFRVTKAKNCKGRKRSPPVILMHGLLQSSDSWLDAGPNAGLAYLISDACHDLWVANCRGNYYSRNHLELDPDKNSQFWKFSVDEIGFYDVPSTIDYVLRHTGVEKVNYIGFSQGAGTFFIMCSERPGYCEKVNVLITLAPAARQTNTKSVPYRLLTAAIMNIEGLLRKYEIYEIFSKGSFGQEFLAFFCQLNWLSGRVCSTGQSMLDAFHPESVAEHTTRSLFGHFPAGTSVHNMARYGQSMVSEDFAKFDYGADNFKVYNSDYPPLYNLSAVSIPVVTIYGKNDGLVDVKDVEWLNDKLPNVVESFLVEDPYWNHLDVTYSRHTSVLVFPKINEYLLRYSVIQNLNRTGN